MSDPEVDRWALTLYVNGASPLSIESIETVRNLCDHELAGRVDLVVADVHGQPQLVLRDAIIATPTLIKRLPAPRRRLVGQISDADRVRLGLDLGSLRVPDDAEPN